MYRKINISEDTLFDLVFIDYKIEGIDRRDCPDFSDAFISEATAILPDGDTRDATEHELDELNDDSTLVYELVIDSLY